MARLQAQRLQHRGEFFETMVDRELILCITFVSIIFVRGLERSGVRTMI